MAAIRKYWFMLFLLAVLVAWGASLLEPSWEPGLRLWVSAGFAVAIVYGIYDRLERIEGKLDAILKKLRQGMRVRFSHYRRSDKLR
jgi:hypothetical protein